MPALLQSGSPVIRSAAIVFDSENDQLRFRQLVDDRVGKARNPAPIKLVFELPESGRSFSGLPAVIEAAATSQTILAPTDKRVPSGYIKPKLVTP